MHVIRELLSYFDNDGHWNQFGTTLDHAIEVYNDFSNGGHWDQCSTLLDCNIRISKLS